MKILLYEYISGGGYSRKPIPASLLCEGYGMLRGITSDFRSAGHKLVILLDERVAPFWPTVEDVEIVTVRSPRDIDSVTEGVAEKADAALIIAPEQDRILPSIVEKIEKTKILSLNCNSKAIEQTSNKAGLLDRAQILGLDIPKTVLFGANESSEGIIKSIESTFGFPAVIKPINSAGSNGLSIIWNKKQVAEAVVKARNESSISNFMAQEFVKGTDASVSLICTKTGALPLSLNLQKIKLTKPFGHSDYTGGQVPLEHPLKEKAFEAANKLLTSFAGLQGYVGVDFVLTADKAYVIEVNPRLTTSYIGLRKIVNFNLGKAILDSASKNELPTNLASNGVALFNKVSVNSPVASTWENLSKIEGMVSPPFPLEKTGTSYAMLESCGTDVNQASHKLNITKNQLEQVLTSRGAQAW